MMSFVILRLWEGWSRLNQLEDWNTNKMEASTVETVVSQLESTYDDLLSAKSTIRSEMQNQVSSVQT